MSAVSHWKEMVVAEHAQSEAMRPVGSGPPADHWRPYAQNFRADPRRSGDPWLDSLLHHVFPGQTLMDVGAGGGRLALPFALRCRWVTAVEPSPSMVEVMESEAREHGITNLSVVHARWEDAEIEPVDVVLSVHVLYVVQEIEFFIRKMENHARDKVMVALYEAAPQSQIYPLWREVHGSPRLALPSAPHLREVLGELGVEAEEHPLPAPQPRGYDSPDHALEQISRRLYLAEEDPKRQGLSQILETGLEEVDGIYHVKGAEPMKPVLFSWCPGGEGGRG